MEVEKANAERMERVKREAAISRMIHQVGPRLYDRFIKSVKNVPPSFTPIKELHLPRNHSYNFNILWNKKMVLSAYALLIQKIRGRWVFCKNRAEKFLLQGLYLYFKVGDPRRKYGYL